jgi:hypothetical protein
MTETLTYQPIRDGYSATMSYPVIETKLEAGQSRRRLDHLFAPHTVNLNWILTSPTDYNRFMGFFNTTIHNGTDTFFLDLLTNIGIPTKHRVRVSGDLPKLTQQRGLAYWVSGTLEVELNPTYTTNFLYSGTLKAIGKTLTNPTLLGPIQIGDTVRLFDSAQTHVGGTALDFDGTYVVDAASDTNNIFFTSGTAAAVPSWATLAALIPATTAPTTHATLIRVPT